MLDADEIINRFTYHAPKPELRQMVRFENIREAGREFAILVAESTPNCREQALAITKIEEAVMWANAAIARRES